jgi:hypothetical protein
MSEKRQDNLLPLPRGVEVTPVGLNISAKLSYEQWSDLVKRTQRTHRSILWVIGDLLCYGESRWSQKFSQAIEEHSEQTWLNAMWVSSKIEPIRRLMQLSWSHHQQVAALPPDEQDKFLKIAHEKKLSVHELRKAIRLSRVIEEPQQRSDFRDMPDAPEILPDVEPEAEPQFADMDVRPSHYYPEIPERIGNLESTEKASADGDLKHLIDLVRSLRTALRGDLSRGIKPDDAAASRYWNALDLFLARFA